MGIRFIYDNLDQQGCTSYLGPSRRPLKGPLTFPKNLYTIILIVNIY